MGKIRSYLKTYHWLIAGIALQVLGVVGILDGTMVAVPDVSAPENRFGWDEGSAKVDAPRIAAQMPAFAITDTDGNVLSGAGKSAELWRFAKVCNNGKHIPTWRQESGDCVSMGWSNALAYRMAYQIAQDGRSEKLEIPFPPYMYGVSRVQIGKRRIRGQGSVGAWAAQGSQSYGVATTPQAESNGFKYSGKLADNWGWNGPPKVLIDLGKQHRVNQISPVRSWEDVRDALAYGFTVTVASNVGFDGGYYDRDGKRWLKRGGRWAHQMCFVGMEDRPGRSKGAFCLNSWGVDAHPKPIGDEPPGGFWVDWQTVQAMVQQGDSWAYSDFDGFVIDADTSGADWNIFKQDVIADSGDTQDAQVKSVALDEVEKPDEVTIPDQIHEVRKWNSARVGSGASLSGTVCMLVWLMRRRTSRRRRSSKDCSC